MASSEGSENLTVQFTKEAVDALLSDKPITKESDLKGELEYLTEHNRKLKLCVKWFQRVDATHLLELERLRNSLEFAEKKCMDAEFEMEKKLGELNESPSQPRKECSDLREDLGKQAAMIVAALKCRAKEDEIIDKVAKEKLAACPQDSVGRLREELLRERELCDCVMRHLCNFRQTTQESFTQLEVLKTEAAELKGICSSQLEEIQMFRHQLAAANEELKMADLSAIETKTQIDEQKRTISELQGRLSIVEIQLVEGEQFRRKQHNTILELKGNIRVFCRVRPLLTGDGLESERVIFYPTSVGTIGRRIELVQTAKRHIFEFDKVFTQEASQHEVFAEVSGLIQSALDGYKVCIFAYGQTTSGKTYTMFGKSDAQEQKGLILRSLEQIFEASQTVSVQGWKYQLEASMLEIYNNKIHDLLLPSGVTGRELPVKYDADGEPYVANLTVVDIGSITEITSLLGQAAQRRSVGTTVMNEQSSRSHSVFTLRILGVNENTGQELKGALNLIDLAGSERNSTSGAVGDRFEEAKAINQSLSFLKEVINAISQKKGHVPFRNCTLTRILEPYLCGDSKTLMFVNISPEASSAAESLMSLRFADQVKSCDIRVAGLQSPTSQSSVRPSSSRRPMHPPYLQPRR